jgi:hypothetical protein
MKNCKFSSHPRQKKKEQFSANFVKDVAAIYDTAMKA